MIGLGDIDLCLCTWNNTKRLGRKTGRIGNQWKNRDDPEQRTSKIGKNSEERTRNLKRLFVTLNIVRNQALTLV